MLTSTPHYLPSNTGGPSRNTFPVASSTQICRRPSLCTSLRRHSTSRHNRQGQQHRQHTVHVCAAQNRSLSFTQRWRIVKGAATEKTDEAKAAFRALPPVQAFLRFMHLLRQKLDPLFRLLHVIEAWIQARQAGYVEFRGEEVKREWEWKRRTQKEWDLWISTINFVKMQILTLFWLTITPVSFFWGALLPLHLSWILYDHPLKSPIFLTLMPMFLIKFPIGYPVRWF